MRLKKVDSPELIEPIEIHRAPARHGNKAWRRQRQLKETYHDEEVPDLDELVQIIQRIKAGNVNHHYQTARARALFAMYYLTACRASEIVKVTSLRKSHILKKKVEGYREMTIKKVPHNYVGVRCGDIKFKEIDGHLCMLIRTENRKNKTRATKRQPIPIEKESEIAEFIKYYIQRLKSSEYLFPFGVKRATQIINLTTGFNIHFIRHIRATHLVTKYDFNEQMLIKFMGWTDGRPAKFYMELSSKDLFKQFYKSGN